MKLMSSGWVYDIPPETGFIEVTPMDGERAYVAVFDADGKPLARLSGDMVPAPEPWMKRVTA